MEQTSAWRQEPVRGSRERLRVSSATLPVSLSVLCVLTIPFLRPVSECTGMRTVVTVPNSEKKSRTAFSSASKLSPPTKMVLLAPPFAVTTAPESVLAFFKVSSTVVPLLFLTGTSSSESLEEEEDESRLRFEAGAFAAGAAAAALAGAISASESEESELEEAAFLAGVAFKAGDLAFAAAGAAFFCGRATAREKRQ